MPSGSEISAWAAPSTAQRLRAVRPAGGRRLAGDDVILTDEEGNAYRLVGTAGGNFVTAADPEDEFAPESGFFA